MRISVEWLNELIDLKTLNFDYLVEKLTLGGFEVEDSFEFIINPVDNLVVFDDYETKFLCPGVK